MSTPSNIADPGKRLVAYIIDSLIIGSISGIIGTIALIPLISSFVATDFLNNEPPPALIGGSIAVFFFGVIFIYAFIFLYFAWQHSSKYQATLGKRAMKLYVTDDHGDRLTFGKACVRVLGRFINGMTMMIGWVLILFSDKKQGLHDMIASTLVLDGTKDQNTEDEEFETFYEYQN